MRLCLAQLYTQAPAWACTQLSLHKWRLRVTEGKTVLFFYQWCVSVLPTLYYQWSWFESRSLLNPIKMRWILLREKASKGMVVLALWQKSYFPHSEWQFSMELNVKQNRAYSTTYLYQLENVSHSRFLITLKKHPPFHLVSLKFCVWDLTEMRNTRTFFFLPL